MIFKNRFKDYLLTGVIFGVGMGMLQCIRYQSIIMGIISALILGFTFSLFIFLFSKLLEKKYDKMRDEISKDREIICDGAATLRGNGGWIFFTDIGFEFYPHKINFSRKQIIIPEETVISVDASGRALIIRTEKNEVYKFFVAQSKSWKRLIDDNLL